MKHLKFIFPLFSFCILASANTPLSLTDVYLQQYAQYKYSEYPSTYHKDPETILSFAIGRNLKNCCPNERFDIVEKTIRSALNISRKKYEKHVISFFHGRSGEFFVIDTLLKYLKKPTPFIGNPQQRKNASDSALNRITQLMADYEKLPAREKHQQHDGMIDTDAWVSKRLLSTTLSLFANSLTDFHFQRMSTISALYFFTRGSNLLAPEKTLMNIFKNLGIQNPQEFYQATHALYEKHKTPEGQLLVISIPLDKIDTYAYLSQMGGKPELFYSEATKAPSPRPISAWITTYINNERFFNDEWDVQVRIIDLDLHQAYQDGVTIDILSTMSQSEQALLEKELFSFFETYFNKGNDMGADLKILNAQLQVLLLR